VRLLNLLDIVHACECLVGLILAAESHESEATTAVGVSVFDDDLIRSVKDCKLIWKRYTHSLFDITILGESFSQSLVGGVPR
jgi:hypothetical protein